MLAFIKALELLWMLAFIKALCLIFLRNKSLNFLFIMASKASRNSFYKVCLDENIRNALWIHALVLQHFSNIKIEANTLP